MQNAGSKYLKPSSGPREQPVTNLKLKMIDVPLSSVKENN